MNDAIEITRTFTQEDFNKFARLSGDDNPIHVDTEFSKRTSFGRTVSHGMLLYTVLRGLIERLAPKANHISQELMFPAPAFADEPLQFEAKLIEAQQTQKTFSVQAFRLEDNQVVVEGLCTLKTEPEGRI